MCNRKDLLRRFGAFVAALSLCFTLSIPVLAEESVSGNVVFNAAQRTSSGDWTASSTASQLSAPVSFNSCAIDNSASKYIACYALRYVNLQEIVDNFGEYGIYFSFYYKSTDSSYSVTQSKIPSASDFSLSYIDQSTGVRVSKPVTVSLFNPTGEDNPPVDGVSIKASLSNTLASPVASETTYLCLVPSFNSLVPTYYAIASSPAQIPVNKASYMINSFRVVSTDSSATLSSLENIADKLTEQNEMLSAYYGDIVEVCNKIYQRLGDMQATEEEAVTLLSGVISALDTTNSKLSAINQAMSTYFELVLKALSNESLSIQQAIADAELALETYLKPVIDYFNELEETTGESADSLPGHKADLDGFTSTNTGIDADAQTGLAAILPILGAFSFVFQILGIFIGIGILNIIIRKGLS